MADSDDDSATPSHYAYAAGPQVVIMEGPLKKRGAKMPVMRDRYCVATWEQDPTGENNHKAVVLRSYKTQAAYTKQPQKPVSVHTLKCVSEWNGKGNFHTYPHGFVMETMDKKLFHCAAPTEDDKTKWIELMSTVSTPRTVVDDPQHSHNNDRQKETGGALFDSDTSDDGHGQLADPNEIHDAENALSSGGDDEEYYDDEEESYDDEDELDTSGVALSPPDEQLLFRAESSESLMASLDGDRRKHDEPDDWGIYGESDGHDGRSRYDVVDADPKLLLDKELLNGPPKSNAAPMASDDFLFERSGPTFGAVVVPASSGGDGDDEFVDPRVQERVERKKKEKQRLRVAKKLESNRDLYAEMAAARLNSMRKDAKTKPRRSITRRRSDLDSDDDEVWTSEEEDEGRQSSSYRREKSSVDDADSRPSIASQTVSETPNSAVAFELEEVDSADEMLRRQKSARLKSKEKKRQMKAAAEAEAEDEADQGLFNDDLLFGEASAPVEEERSIGAVDEEVDEEEQRRLRKEERKKKKRQQRAEEEARAEAEARAAAEHTLEEAAGVKHEDEDDSEEQRRLEKQRRKEERRARKERERREAEEAAHAEELARQHREAMLRLEEEKMKQERRERKDRKKQKEKGLLDKKAKELKKKEAMLAAEAEMLKQTQEALAMADELKDSRKKKRRDKYTSPADRIQRREKEAQALSSEMSSALVLVETAAPSAPAPTPVATVVETPLSTSEASSAEDVAVSKPVPASVAAPTSTATATTTAVPVNPAPPVSAPAAFPVGVAAQQSQAEPVVQPAPQSAPVQFPQGMAPQGYYPGYPPPPQSYPMPYPYAAPYPGVQYNPGFAHMPYGAGMAMPSPYYPHLGYVGGIAPVAPMSGGFAMMQPPPMQPASQAESSEENAFIGPQLPSPKSFKVEPAAPEAPAPPPPPSSAKSYMVLPDLPDVAEF